jgi:hypothetical protein
MAHGDGKAPTFWKDVNLGSSKFWEQIAEDKWKLLFRILIGALLVAAFFSIPVVGQALGIFVLAFLPHITPAVFAAAAVLASLFLTFGDYWLASLDVILMFPARLFADGGKWAPKGNRFLEYFSAVVRPIATVLANISVLLYLPAALFRAMATAWHLALSFGHYLAKSLDKSFSGKESEKWGLADLRGAGEKTPVRKLLFSRILARLLDKGGRAPQKSQPIKSLAHRVLLAPLSIGLAWLGRGVVTLLSTPAFLLRMIAVGFNAIVENNPLSAVFNAASKIAAALPAIPLFLDEALKQLYRHPNELFLTSRVIDRVEEYRTHLCVARLNPLFGESSTQGIKIDDTADSAEQAEPDDTTSSDDEASVSGSPRKISDALGGASPFGRNDSQDLLRGGTVGRSFWSRARESLSAAIPSPEKPLPPSASVTGKGADL